MNNTTSNMIWLNILDAHCYYQISNNRYAGPGFQAVKEEWKMGGWAAYLAGTKGIIVAMIDGRGSGNNGDRR